VQAFDLTTNELIDSINFGVGVETKEEEVPNTVAIETVKKNYYLG